MVSSSDNGVLLLPTDTVPGIASTTDAPSLAALRAAFGALAAPDPLPLTWHTADPFQPPALLAAPSPLLKRAASRLWPGPVTLAIEFPDHARPAIDRLLGHAIADDGQTLWVRIPDHAAAQRFIAAAPTPILARGIPDGHGGLCPTLASARARLTAAGIKFRQIDGPDGSGLPSTLVRLPRGGGYKVERTGAMSAETVRQRLTTHILFVCTGNTCRSPMAERIARHLAERLPAGSAPVEVASAGVSALAGEPTTPEALEALRRMEIHARTSGARPLDAAAIRWADRVYVMTASHLREALRQGASSAQLLDPAGLDVPDPIGGTQHQYDQTARRLAEAIGTRLQELSS